MFFEDVPDVTVESLRGDVTVEVRKQASGVDVSKDGDFELCLSFPPPGAEYGVELRLRPRLQPMPRLGRSPAIGAVRIIAPPGTNVHLLDCHGRLIWPDGSTETLAGDSKFAT